MDNLFYKKLQEGSELDPVNDMFSWTEKIIREVHEDEEKWIFETIKPFIGSVTDMEITKEELIRAISLIRLQREASIKFGVMISNDWNTAKEQCDGLTKAYLHGYDDGYSKCKNEIKEFINDEYGYKFKED